MSLLKDAQVGERWVTRGGDVAVLLAICPSYWYPYKWSTDDGGNYFSTIVDGRVYSDDDDDHGRKSQLDILRPVKPRAALQRCDSSVWSRCESTATTTAGPCTSRSSK